MKVVLEHFCRSCMRGIPVSMAELVRLLVSEASHRCACGESALSAMQIMYEHVSGLREHHASLLGGEIRAFDFEIRPNESLALDLTQNGVPELADVIYIEYINRRDGLNIYATALDYGSKGALPRNVVAVHGVVEDSLAGEESSVPAKESFSNNRQDRVGRSKA